MTGRHKSTSRLRMAAPERREAILDAAMNLFSAHGWDRVTLADVLAAADISKGGFYHHFASKEALLDGIIIRMAERGLSAASADLDPGKYDAMTRFNRFFENAARWKAGQASELRLFTDILSRPGNDLLFQRVFEAISCAILPVIEGLIRDGVTDGTFDVVDTGLTAEIIVGLSRTRRALTSEVLGIAEAGELDRAADLLENRMRAEAMIYDRLLGLPDGSVRLSNPVAYRDMLAGMTS